MKKLFTITLVVYLLILASCSQNTRDTAILLTDDSRAAVRSFAQREDDGLLQLAQDDTKTRAVVDIFRSLHWDADPPADTRDTQTAVYDDLRIRISGEHGELIKSIGEQYAAGEIGREGYHNTMRIIAAVLDGILHSHESIHEPGVDSLNSILTYAANLRGGVSSELKKHGFEGDAVLTDEQHALLREAARYQRYELFDDLP